MRTTVNQLKDRAYARCKGDEMTCVMYIKTVNSYLSGFVVENVLTDKCTGRTNARIRERRFTCTQPYTNSQTHYHTRIHTCAHMCTRRHTCALNGACAGKRIGARGCIRKHADSAHIKRTDAHTLAACYCD